MRYQDGSGLLKVAKDQDSPACCVSLGSVRFRVFFGVRRRNISPRLSLINQWKEQPTRDSPPFIHLPLRLEPIAIVLVFFLGSKNFTIIKELRAQKYHSRGVGGEFGSFETYR